MAWMPAGTMPTCPRNGSASSADWSAAAAACPARCSCSCSATGSGARSRELWAEERKVRYRDERKIAYGRFFRLLDDLDIALIKATEFGPDEVRSGQVRSGPPNEPIKAALTAIKPSLDELRPIGSTEVHRLPSRSGSAIVLGGSGLPESPGHTYGQTVHSGQSAIRIASDTVSWRRPSGDRREARERSLRDRIAASGAGSVRCRSVGDLRTASFANPPPCKGEQS